MPSFLVLTIPMSFLVGTLTAFTRLCSDSEVTAMKASRISLYEMIRPVMLFAVLSFLITAAISLVVAPGANHALKLHLFNLVKSRALIGIEPGVFSSTFDGRVIFVDMNSLDDMQGIFISDEHSAEALRDRGSGKLAVTTLAQRGAREGRRNPCQPAGRAVLLDHDVRLRQFVP
jgi:lipopolysaccharide export system permease protein